MCQYILFIIKRCVNGKYFMGKNKLEERNIILYGICTYYAWVCMKQPLQLSNQSVWPNSLGIETTISQLRMVTSVPHRTAVNSNKNLYIYYISIRFYNCQNHTAVKPLIPHCSIRCYHSEPIYLFLVIIVSSFGLALLY